MNETSPGEFSRACSFDQDTLTISESQATHAVTNQTKPYAEFQGLIDRGSNTVRDQVQLYR